MAEVFISYARTDQGFARDLNAALQKLQRDTWIDWRSIPDSAQWRAEIFAAIEAADNFLFIISPNSLRSKMCGLEVAHAAANNKRIVTILYHPVDRHELLPGLNEIQWINYPELGFDPTFQRLITAIDTDLDWVRQHTRFGLRAVQWQTNNRDNGFLLHGTELREAIRWLEHATTLKGQQPTQVHEHYIHASEEWEAGEVKRQTELRERAEKTSRVAISRELVAFSTLSLEDDPERSILLAMHAVKATRSVDHAVIPEAEDALHRAILKCPIRVRVAGSNTPVYAVALIGADGTPQVREFGRGRELNTLQGHSDRVNSVAVSGDGRLVVSASYDQTLKIWELKSGRELRTLKGHSEWAKGVAVSGNGRLAVSASDDQTLKVWEVASGRELHTLEGHSNWVESVALSRDGRLAVSASWDTTLKVWAVRSGRELRTLDGHSGFVTGVAMSGDARLAVSASNDQTLKVWEVASGRELRTIQVPFTGVNLVAVSGDGRIAVSASYDGTLKVWELKSGRELGTLTGHTHTVTGVAVSPDGTRVASASFDKTVRVWDMDTGRELITLAAHSGPVRSVAWAPDGKRLLSGGDDGIIQVYAMDVDLLMSLARSRATRNLTPEECRRYLHRDDAPRSLEAS